jgi:hypothetical protein
MIQSKELIKVKKTQWILVLLVTIAFTSVASAQEEQAPAGCNATEITAAPTRPTVTTSTTTTQCGVLEADYGLTSFLPGDGTHQEVLGGSLRYGITPRIDFRWGVDNMHSYYGANTHFLGTGDNWLGGRVRLTSEKQTWASTAFAYTIKLPTASVADGFGTGFVDHSFTFIASKDVRKWHFDFNSIETLAGRPVSGFDTNNTLALAAAHPLKGKWGIVDEGWGQTRLNAVNPAFASNLIGFTYNLSERTVFDCGADLGLTPDAPRAGLLVGVTYAIGNLNAMFRK